MKFSGLQCTIRQLMITTVLVALIFALAARAIRGDDWAILIVVIIWSTTPIWGAIGLGLLPPPATRILFLASCVMILPAFGYSLYRYTILNGLIANEWLLWGFAALWQILPFGIGHALSMNFHSWRVKNRLKHDRGAAIHPPTSHDYSKCKCSRQLTPNAVASAVSCRQRSSPNGLFSGFAASFLQVSELEYNCWKAANKGWEADQWATLTEKPNNQSEIRRHASSRCGPTIVLKPNSAPSR